MYKLFKLLANKEAVGTNWSPSFCSATLVTPFTRPSDLGGLVGDADRIMSVYVHFALPRMMWELLHMATEVRPLFPSCLGRCFLQPTTSWLWFQPTHLSASSPCLRPAPAPPSGPSALLGHTSASGHGSLPRAMAPWSAMEPSAPATAALATASSFSYSLWLWCLAPASSSDFDLKLRFSLRPRAPAPVPARGACLQPQPSLTLPHRALLCSLPPPSPLLLSC